MFIILRNVFQIAVGLGLILNSNYNIYVREDVRRANHNNNMIKIDKWQHCCHLNTV